MSVIAAVAAIAVGGTIAYFSDTETSTGNTFTAGSVDLDDGLSAQKFDLSGMKPGDMGNGIYAISATSNNYWACMKSTIDTTPENDILEMETVAGDGTSDVGELQDYLYFYVWNDRDGVPGYQGVGTGTGTWVAGQDRNLVGPYRLLNYPNGLGGVSSPLEDASAQSFFGSSPLVAGQTYNLGIAYCFGTFGSISSGQNTGLTCSGDLVDQNVAQTDGVTGTTTFYAVQSDNNAGFVCSGASY